MKEVESESKGVPFSTWMAALALVVSIASMPINSCLARQAAIDTYQFQTTENQISDTMNAIVQFEAEAGLFIGHIAPVVDFDSHEEMRALRTNPAKVLAELLIYDLNMYTVDSPSILTGLHEAVEELVFSTRFATTIRKYNPDSYDALMHLWASLDQPWRPVSETIYIAVEVLVGQHNLLSTIESLDEKDVRNLLLSD